MNKQHLINHVALVIDSSGSMQPLEAEVIKVVDNQVAFLAALSTKANQETRVSIYLFNYNVDCIVYDRDVLRLPSLKSVYSPTGGTALIDGTLSAMRDLKLTPQIHADHAFLMYVVTDGENNIGNDKAARLRSEIEDLHKTVDNWSFGVFVPDNSGVDQAERFGFPRGNIQIWDTSASGIETANKQMQTSTETFFTQRAAGIRGSKTLFAGISVKPSVLKKKLTEVSAQNFRIFQTKKDIRIDDFCKKELGKFVKGNAYYQLVKTEEIQPSKLVMVQEQASGKVYSGDQARQLLNIPPGYVKVKPGNFKNFDVFVQSTSDNRKIPVGSKMLVLV